MKYKRGYNRKELLELLVAANEENEFLKNRIDELEEKIKSKEIKAEKAGSLAEAALEVNGFFEAAQNASIQYLENIRRQSEEAEYYNESIKRDAMKSKEYIINAANEEAKKIIEEAERAARKTEKEVYARCERMITLAYERIEKDQKTQNMSK